MFARGGHLGYATNQESFHTDIQFYGKGVHILAEAGPCVIILKPRGLAVNGRSKESDCIINRLMHIYGGKWCALRRFWLPVKTYGVVICARVSDVPMTEELTHDAPMEFCFEAVVYGGNSVCGGLLDEETLALPAIRSEAVLCKLEEAGRLAHILVHVALASGNASSSGVADALADAFAKADCPIIGTLKSCRRLKKGHLLKNERALSLVRILCGRIDVEVPLDNRLKNLILQERTFAALEDTRHDQNMNTLIDLLTGPKAGTHCEYAPELQRLGMRWLGRTSDAARNVLDELKLFEPQDKAWVEHANAQLEKSMLEQWCACPHDRERLQYGMHVSRLLCCFVRVKRDSLSPVELLMRGMSLENDLQTEASGPLHATELCFDRSNHCELLALNKAYALCLEHSLTGEDCAVDLVVAHQPCVSCTAAMCNFVAMLPDARLRVGFRDWGLMQRALNAAVRARGDPVQ